jgi:hypothetical protein
MELVVDGSFGTGPKNIESYVYAFNDPRVETFVL